MLAMLASAGGLYAQADVQAGAINLLAKFSGEEIVLQSSDYSFDTKYGRIRVKLGKSANASDARLVLTPPLEGDTGSMAKQVAALVSALEDSLGDSGNKDVLEAISKVLNDGVGDAGGAEGDVTLDIASKVDDNNDTTVSIKFKGDDTTVDADLVVKSKPDGSTGVSGETKTGDGGTSKVDLIVKDGSSTGTIGGRNVSELPSEKIETSLKEASVTDKRADGSTKKTDYVNNPDGTSTTTTTEKDSSGNTTSSGSSISDSKISAGDVGKNTESAGGDNSAGENPSSGGTGGTMSGIGGDGGLPDNTIISEEQITDFSGKDISGQDLSDKTFSGVKFRSTKAVGTNFENSQLDKTDFNSANLTDANLKNANASGADFTNATLVNADATNANFGGAKLDGADLSGLTIAGANFSGSDLTRDQLYSTRDYSDGTIRGLNISGLDVSGWDFKGKTISDMDARNITANVAGQYKIHGLEFGEGANISNLNLDGARISSTEGATSIGLFLSRSNIDGITLDGASVYAQAENEAYGLAMAGADIKNLSAKNATFVSDNTASSTTHDKQTQSCAITMYKGKLTNADFSGATVISTGVNDSASSNATVFIGANFDGSTLENVNFNNSVIKVSASNGLGSGATISQGICLANTRLNNGAASGIAFSADNANISVSAENSGGSVSATGMNLLRKLGDGKISARGIEIRTESVGTTVADSIAIRVGTSENLSLDFNGAKFEVKAENWNDRAFAHGFSSLGVNVSIKDSDFSNSNFIIKSNSGQTGSTLGFYINGNITNTAFTNVKISEECYSIGTINPTDHGSVNAEGFALINGNMSYTNFENVSITLLAQSDNRGTTSHGFSLRTMNVSNSNFDGMTISATSKSKSSTDYAFSYAFLLGLLRSNDSESEITNSSFRNADFTAYAESASTKAYSYGFSSSRSKLTNIDFSGANFNATSQSPLGEAYGASFGRNTLKNVNFQNVSVRAVENSKDVTRTNGMNFAGATLDGVDFRGSNVSDYCVDTAASLTNVLYADGRIRNFSASNSAYSINLIAHKPKAGQNAISAKIFYDDAVVYNAVLKLFEDAQLEVLNGKSLTVSDNGDIHIVMNPDSGIVPIMLSDGASFILDGGGIRVDITHLPLEHSFTIMQWTDDCYVASLLNLVKDLNIVLCVDDEQYTGAWNFSLNSNSLEIILGTVIPEPAETAALLASAALAAALFLRRRK